MYFFWCTEIRLASASARSRCSSLAPSASAYTTTGMVMVMGEISTTAYADIPSIVRKTVERMLGFDESQLGPMAAMRGSDDGFLAAGLKGMRLFSEQLPLWPKLESAKPRPGCWGRNNHHVANELRV